MNPRVNVWIERGGQVVLSEWRVQLLEAVRETGSISEAARRQNIDYRTAWRKLKEMEERLGVRLTQRKTGGEGGGGTILTRDGEEYVKRFRNFTRGFENEVTKRFHKAFTSR